MPVTGAAVPFARAVAQFDVEFFLDQVKATGADYLLFTATHALQYLPAPCAILDAILPGRTTRRDLIGELAEGCFQRQLRFLLYYNHSCNQADDRMWENAVGYHAADKNYFAGNICSVVGELGDRLGAGLSAWWFDSAYSLDPRGPYVTVSTDMKGWLFPWEQLTHYARRGNPHRLVTYNPGLDPGTQDFLYTAEQDYLAGETPDLSHPPADRVADNGLQNHRWLCLDNAAWVHGQAATPLAQPRYDLKQLREYYSQCQRNRTPLTFNVDVDQVGNMCALSLDVLRNLSDLSGGGRPY